MIIYLPTNSYYPVLTLEESEDIRGMLATTPESALANRKDLRPSPRVKAVPFELERVP